MIVNQVSVFIENEPGRLVAILEVLEKRRISIQAISVSDAAEIGIVRMILTDPDGGLQELRSAGFIVRLDKVLSIEIPDVPGGFLRSVAKPIADAGINIHYFYAYTETSTGKTMVIVKTDNLDKTEKVLKQVLSR